MPGLAGEVANLIVALKLDDSGFTGKLNAAGRTLKGMDSGLSRVGRGVGQVGSGLARLGTIATTAAAGGLAAVVTTAVSFEDAFAGVKKTVEGTEMDLAVLRASFRQMATEIPLSFEELSKIGEQAGALGIATQDIEEFTRVAALIGVTTDVSSDQAATALGQLSNVLGLTNKDFERFASTLVDLGNKGASTESQILDITSRAGAGANLIGIAADETLAWASAVANLGIEVEAGGSSLQTFFLQSRKNLEVTGRLRIMARTAGVAAGEFKRAFEEDASGALQSFIEGLGELDQAAQLRVLDDLKLKGIRIQRALLGLANSGDNLNDSLKVANEEWERNNALQAEAEKRFETTASQMVVFKNRIRDTAATIGAGLLPVVNDLIGDLGEFLLKHDAEIDQFGQDLAKGIRGLVNELKGTDFSGIIGGMKIAARVAKGAFDAFRALPEPIQQLAIAALVANKVSGGAVGQIAKGLGNIALGGGKIFAGLRGQTPASPQYVWVVNQGVGGGGRGAPLPPGAAPPGFLAPGLGTLGAGVALPFLMFNLIPELFRKAGGGQSVRRTNEAGETIVELGPTSTAMMQGLMPSFISSVEQTGGEVLNAVNDDTHTLAAGVDTLRDETRQLHDPLLGIKAINERSALGIDQVRDETRQLQQITGAELREVQRREQETAERIRDARTAIHEQKLALDSGFARANDRLAVIASKDPSVNVDVLVPVTNVVSVRDVVYTSTVVGTIRNNIPVGP